MSLYPSPYELLAVAFLIQALLVLFCYVTVSRLSRLEEDLGRVRRHEASRRSREMRWLTRHKASSLALVRDDGTEEPLKVRRFS